MPCWLSFSTFSIHFKNVIFLNVAASFRSIIYFALGIPEANGINIDGVCVESDGTWRAIDNRTDHPSICERLGMFSYLNDFNNFGFK